MSSKSSERPAPSGPVASPCRRQCCLDEQDICLGCGRQLAEILEWGSASDERRAQICRLAAGRVRPHWGG
ncbi:MAG: DUF1289 domain-containing protein [Pseudomonas sp.]|nr:DUF1289 domain-containing protein [Pseudomonas sp.]